MLGDKMKREIGKKLSLYRAKRGLTQEQLAEEMNISRSKVSSWETGRRDISITDLIYIADFFNLSIDNLLDNRYTNKDEYLEVSKLFLENENIDYEDKREVLLELKRILVNKDIDKILL